MLASVLMSVATVSGGGVAAPAFHAFASVNDSRSHGVVGDNFLSLNEAIQLHNNTLLHNQLSPAEQAQILLIPGTGTSTFLSWARFDGSFIPVITIERDLDVIVNTTYGLFLSSDNDPTTLDFSGANITRGMRATSNSLQMRDFIFSGGPYGIDVVQSDIAGQIGFAINDCRFENHTQFGVRIATNTANGFGKAYLERCVFDNTATGIVFDESPAGRTSFFDLHDCRFTGVTHGVNVYGGGGGTGRYTFDRLVIDALITGINFSGNIGRSAQMLMRHIEVRAPTCVDIACTPLSPTIVSMQMMQLLATTAAPTALRLGVINDDLSGVFEDSTLNGHVTFGAGGGTAPLTLANLRCRDGLTLLSTTPTQQFTVSDSRFDNCAMSVSGAAPIAFTNCCLDLTSTIDGTATSSALFTDSYVPNPGAFVTSSTPRSQEQLGSMSVLPDTPTIGSTVTFQADLPNGLFGAFLLGFTDPNPTLLPQPLHIYGYLANTYLIPIIVRSQQTVPWVIPNNIAFRGLDVVAQIAVLPDPGVGAQAVQLAPGRRFALQ